MSTVVPEIAPGGPDGGSMRGQKLKALHDAFMMIDTDNSGTISASEFGTLLRLQGEDVSDDDAKMILEQIDVDGDATNLTFDEFVEIMDQVEMEGGNKFDIASAFAKRAKEKSSFFQAKDPLYVKLQREAQRKANANSSEAEGPGASIATGGNARMQLASIVDGNTTQVIVLALIVLDVVCVFMELLLLWTKCPCKARHDTLEDAKQYIPYAYGLTSYSGYGGSSYSSYGDIGSAYGDSGSAYGESSAYGAYGDSGGGRRLRIVDWMEEYIGMGDPEDWTGYPVHRNDLLHRFLAGGEAVVGRTSSPYGDPRNDWTCVREVKGRADNVYSGTWWSNEQHHAELILHWCSVSILMIFGLQILSLMALYGMEFFKHFAYVFDAVVIGVALYIEMEPSGMFTGGSLLAILMFWRCLRVVHGLASSVELHHKRSHEKMKGERGKMLEMIVEHRRKGAEKKLYFLHFNEKLMKLGVKPPAQPTHHHHGWTDEHGHGNEGKEGDSIQNDDDVHTAGGSALETAMAFRAGKITHEVLKARLDAEKERCSEAESMYVEIYEQLADHMDGLKMHTDMLGVGDLHHDDGGALGAVHKQNTKQELGRSSSAIGAHH